MGPPLAFVHLPKTAGSTLTTVIRRRHPAAVRADRRQWRAWFRDPTQIPVSSAYTGHMVYGLHELLGCELGYLTLLREPVARGNSQYRHECRDIESSGEGRPPDCEEWVAGSQANLMTLRLAGDGPGDRGRARRQDRALLDRAIEHASSFVVVGTQERFLESLALMADRFGWGLPRAGHDRVAPRYEPLPPSAADALRRRNALDVELYEVMSERLAGEVGAVRRRTIALGYLNSRPVAGAETALRSVRAATRRPRGEAGTARSD